VFTTIMTLVVSAPHLSAQSSSPIGFPESVHLTDGLQRRVDVMLDQSRTFRAQCQRLAETPQLYVRVRTDPSIDAKPRYFHARTTINRVRGGWIVALVDIGATGDPSEWLAHEFEHILEQVEGVELKEGVERSPGVWRTGPGMYETARAVDAGKTVLEELRIAAKVAMQRRAEPPRQRAHDGGTLTNLSRRFSK